MGDSNFPSLRMISVSDPSLATPEAPGAVDGLEHAGSRRKAAQEFASLLFLEVLKAMRAASPQEDSSGGHSLSKDIYTSMLDTEVARLMARRDATGLTAAVEKAIDKLPYNNPTRNRSDRDNQQSGTENTLPPRLETMPSPTFLSFPAIPPVSGVVSSEFGLRRDPLNGSTKWHKGIDIAAAAGTNVVATAPGKVVFSGSAPGYGRMVEILHEDGTLTSYAHNEMNLVALGDEVSAGQTIAYVGSSGRATGAHLHFEFRRDGKPIDPSVLLGSLRKGDRLNSAA
jgi:murein DD-endopeptidase MepM/ murein hydrolase activator NlpD